MQKLNQSVSGTVAITIGTAAVSAGTFGGESCFGADCAPGGGAGQNYSPSVIPVGTGGVAGTGGTGATTTDTWSATLLTNLTEPTVAVTKSVTFTNAAAQSITLGSLSISGAGWTASAGACTPGALLSPGATCAATATYTPSTAGTGTANLTLASTLGAEVVTLSGTAAAVFANLTAQSCRATLASNGVQINGIANGTSISVSGGSYATSSDNVTYGSWTTSPGIINPGTWVKVQGASSGSANSSASVTLTIGGTIKTWQTTTGPGTPNAFTFTAPTNVSMNAVTPSNTVSISMDCASAALSSSGAAAAQQCSVNGGAWAPCSGTVANGQTLQVRQTASAVGLTQTDMTVTVGSFTATFSVTTFLPSFTPWASVTNQNCSATATTVGEVIPYVSAGTAVSITNGEYTTSTDNSNWSTWTSSPGSIGANTYVRARLTTSLSGSIAKTATFTASGATKTFTATTGAPGYWQMVSTPVYHSQGYYGQVVSGQYWQSSGNWYTPVTGQYWQSSGYWTQDVIGQNCYQTQGNCVTTYCSGGTVYNCLGGLNQNFEQYCNGEWYPYTPTATIVSYCTGGWYVWTWGVYQHPTGQTCQAVTQCDPVYGPNRWVDTSGWVYTYGPNTYVDTSGWVYTYGTGWIDTSYWSNDMINTFINPYGCS
ncbi:MAG: hypothetical protein D4S02_05750 [Rhodocyclaceae bacterium]|nr:MAG: hypothetical protein D4S02_05750 [Rhodocyclaceae bacterium]